MRLFESKEDRIIREIVQKVVGFTTDELSDKGLISLYVAGTILTRDWTLDSDIDLFGIVDSKFDFNEERKINDFFESIKNTICEGIEARFRAVPISSLEGGEERGVVRFLKAERLIKRFPFFNHVWGEKIDFTKFPVKPMDLKEEALLLIRQIRESIIKLRAGQERFLFRDFPKHVIELVSVEAEKEYGFRFDPLYHKLSEHLKDEESHILHRAMELRKKKASRREIIEFCDDAEAYINDLMERAREWE